jgi:hypothetical protein
MRLLSQKEKDANNDESGNQKSFCERPLYLAIKIQKAKKKKPQVMYLS